MVKFIISVQHGKTVDHLEWGIGGNGRGVGWEWKNGETKLHPMGVNFNLIGSNVNHRTKGYVSGDHYS